MATHELVGAVRSTRLQGNGNKGGAYTMLEGICLRSMGKRRGPGDTDVRERVSEGQPPREEAA